MMFRRIEGGKLVIVPNHPGPLSTGTQRRIMRDAGIEHDEI